MATETPGVNVDDEEFLEKLDRRAEDIFERDLFLTEEEHEARRED